MIDEHESDSRAAAIVPLSEIVVRIGAAVLETVGGNDAGHAVRVWNVHGVAPCVVLRYGEVYYPDFREKYNPLLQIFFIPVFCHPMKIKTAHQLYMKQVEARKKKVRALRAQKLTWKAIGLVLGITGERARQLGKVKNGE